jgi:single-strand DNA-binding protein
MLNYVALTGELEHDPEVQYCEGIDDQLAASFILAFETGNNRTGRIKVTCFGSLAALVGRYLRQGARVAVAGVLDQQQGETADEQENYNFRLIARSLELQESNSRDNTKITLPESRLPRPQIFGDMLRKGSD